MSGKRTFDLLVASCLLLATAPVVLGLAALIRFTSRGPGIFRQERVGQHEKPFTCYKLRTMANGSPNLPSHEASGDAITPLGRRLRRFKLDELPQLWNVVKGDMSLVGPRPCLPTQINLIEARRRYGLYAIRPGITGVAQIAGVDMADPRKLASLDSKYLADMSVKADLRLLVATVRGQGAGDAVRS